MQSRRRDEHHRPDGGGRCRDAALTQGQFGHNISVESVPGIDSMSRTSSAFALGAESESRRDAWNLAPPTPTPPAVASPEHGAGPEESSMSTRARISYLATAAGTVL